MDDTVARAKRGEPAALEALLAEIAPRIERFGRRMCGNAVDADDVLQETLLAVTEHLDEFEGRASFTSWALSVARNACLRKRRGLKNAPTRAETDGIERPDESPTPEAQAFGQELVGLLLEALQSLSPEEREVILLRDVEGLTTSETATILGTSVEASKSRLHRARERLREELRPVLEPDAEPASASCPQVAELWSRQLEGELGQAECAQMERHIASCAACGAACHALKKALGACRKAATTEVPLRVQERVRRVAREWVARMQASTRRTEG